MKLKAQPVNFFFEDILHHSKDTYIVRDVNSMEVVYVNPSYETTWGKKCNELYKKPASYLESIHPEDKQNVLDNFVRLLMGETYLEEEFRIITPGNVVKWLSMKTYLLNDIEVNHPFLVSVAEDISLFRQMENHLEEEEDMSKILAHDLKSPINSIATMVEMLKSELDQPQSEMIGDYIRHIQSICKHSNELIDGLLSLNELKTDFIQTSTLAIDLNEVLREAIEMHINNAKAREIQLHQRLLDKPLLILANKTRILQVADNLLSNALKFTNDGGMISVFSGKLKKKAFFEVTDNGVGIPQEKLPFLFDKFTSAKRYGLRGEKTIGVGMFITKKIIESHHGKINVKSKINEGSSFTIEIPLVKVS